MSLRYSQEEHNVMVSAYADGLNDPEIVERLNSLPTNIERGVKRSVPSVHGRRRSIGMLRADRKPRGEHDPRNEDSHFRAAMLRAIKSGCERVQEGVFHDPTPFTGKMIRPEPCFSGCSSSAELCADSGDAKGAFEPV